MSNRRKPKQERTDSPNFGAKSRWRRPMFPNFPAFDFEIVKPGGKVDGPEKRDRALSGKDRVRARRGRR